MSRDCAYCAIDIFSGTDPQAGKAMEAEPRFIDSIYATRHQADELSTQENLGIEQDQTETQQEEAQCRILGSGRGTHTPYHAITEFDAETVSIFLMDILDLPFETNHNKS